MRAGISIDVTASDRERLLGHPRRFVTLPLWLARNLDCRFRGNGRGHAAARTQRLTTGPARLFGLAPQWVFAALSFGAGNTPTCFITVAKS